MEPANIIIAAPEGVDLTSPQALAALSKLSGDLSRIDGVVKVKSIINPQGTTGAMYELTVSGQLTTLSAALDSSGGDITALFSPETAAGFQQISAYLTELNENFTWVKEDSDYQGALVSLNNMQTAVAQIKADASVTNQLQYLVSQLSQVTAASTTAFTPAQAGQYLQLIAAYLNELGQQYPAIQSDSDYLTALEVCNDGLTLLEQISQLPEDQQVAAGAQLQSGIQNLTTSLTGLASTFQKQDAYLVSQVLAQASGTDSAATATALQSSLAGLKTHLQALSSQFASRDNPVFLSPTLLSASPSFQGLVNMFVSESRQSTLLYVVLDSFSASDRAIQTIDSVRTTLSSSVQDTILSGSEIATGGSSATYTDIKHMVDTDFNRIIILVIIFTFLILVFILRSLIAPMYLLLAVLLSYGATMGLMTLIFQVWLGQEGIFFLIPIITFVLLIALGSDYNIFLMSRIREESEKRGTRDGVRVAAIATGAVILACGVVLAGTFAALSSSPILFMVQFGISVAIGVLIDTAIMQVFLLPAIATKLGKWNWWPSRRD
ncbi:MAG: MMPL family transporter [Dehalococcoidales bacterium]|jgi:RND superfamily putative drug exporter